jgi:motility quorum-sensing regulator / GCU-specific mRNA interferase toxin
MGRGVPTYDLQQLQQLIGQGLVSSWIMGTAKTGAGLVGLGEEEIVDAVLQLTPHHFYKTMESERCPGLWQDVYHLDYRGVRLYVKLQMAVDGRAVVVQFKAR